MKFSLFGFCCFLQLLSITSCAYLTKPKAPWAKDTAVSMVWSKNLDTAHLAGTSHINFNSPSIYQDRLFVGDADGHFIAYHLQDGRILWKVKQKHAVTGKAAIFEDNVIYGTYSGRVFSRDMQTGELDYAIDLGSSVEDAPSVVQGRLIFHTRDHSVIALDAVTGKILWKYKRAVAQLSTLQNMSRPLFYQGHLYLGFADGSVAALRLEDGNLSWEQRITLGQKFVDVDMNPAIINDRLYIASAAGTLHVLKPEDGTILLTLPHKSLCTPLFYHEAILVAGADGRLLLMDVGGSILREKSLSSKAISALALWDNIVVVATVDGHVYFVDGRDFKTIDHFGLGSPHSTVYGEFAQRDEYMAFSSSRSRLYVYRKNI